MSLTSDQKQAIGTDEAGLHDVFVALCDAAALETLPRFRAGGTVTNKLADAVSGETFDPVTMADREAERVIREIIENRFPDHGIVGEEHGTIRADARCQWIIDPVDGTRAFVSGLPVWGTLIALYCDGVPVAGCMDQPFTRERYITCGNGSFLERPSTGQEPNAQQLHTSAVQDIAEATLMTTSPHLLLGAKDAGYFKVEQSARMFRYGCDCYAYAMVAAGHIDIVMESGLNVYDIAALIALIEQAGGIVTNWEGGSAADGGQVLAVGNASLHRQVLDVLQG